MAFTLEITATRRCGDYLARRMAAPWRIHAARHDLGCRRLLAQSDVFMVAAAHCWCVDRIGSIVGADEPTFTRSSRQKRPCFSDTRGTASPSRDPTRTAACAGNTV